MINGLAARLLELLQSGANAKASIRERLHKAARLMLGEQQKS